jgi:hypothetical protein
MLPDNGNIIRVYELEIGRISVYKNFMLAKLNEGIVLTLERAFELIGIAEIHFRNKNFAYITIRKNSYSVDPTIYKHIKELTNLKAIAIVSANKFEKYSFKIEKHFFDTKPMKLFNELEDAINWVKKYIN